MFIMGLEGESLTDNPNMINALKEELGGVIFFTQNIKTAKQFQKLINDIKTEAKVTPFLSIDQEGGRVERTENIFGGKKFLSAKFAAEKGEEFVKEQSEQISILLKNFGVNLNFAPCIDVNTNPNNPIIGERAFSDNTDDVIKFGRIVVDTYLKNKIIPCTKHFPGHGDASVDSHIALPKIGLSLEEMEQTHIKPFKEIDCPMVMVAHMHCSAFDKEEIPTSLSKNAINYLRENLNYNGLIITDDMVMGGVKKETGKEEEGKEIDLFADCAPVKAIKAGVNILLYRNSYDETTQIIDKLAQLAETDQDLLNKINASYDKIISFKSAFLE